MYFTINFEIYALLKSQENLLINISYKGLNFYFTSTLKNHTPQPFTIAQRALYLISLMGVLWKLRKSNRGT